MDKNNVLVVYSTNKSEDDDIKYQKHISDTIGCKHYIDRTWNFGEFSLPQVYNKALRNLREGRYDKLNGENTIIVFMHDDLIFKTRSWGLLLLNHYFQNPNFDIIGLAGSTYMPATGRWWDDRSKMVGIVEHTDGYKEWVSEYSPPFWGVREVVLIDGLFMSCNPKTIENDFDEDFKGFHLYDLSWVIPNYLDGCNIGVISNIRVLHKSVGATNQEWDMNRMLFVDKYKPELPIMLNEYGN